MGLATPQRIRRLQRKLYIKAKDEPAYRFYSLYDKIWREDILRTNLPMPDRYDFTDFILPIGPLAVEMDCPVRPKAVRFVPEGEGERARGRATAGANAGASAPALNGHGRTAGCG